MRAHRVDEEKRHDCVVRPLPRKEFQEVPTSEVQLDILPRHDIW
jgi:hypothetical protein